MYILRSMTPIQLMGLLFGLIYVIDAVPGKLNDSNSRTHASSGGATSASVLQHFQTRNAKKRQLDSNSQKSSSSRDNSSPLRFTFAENVKLQSVENELTYDCPNCADETVTSGAMRWTMPLLKLGEKRYYLGIFFKANWYRASQFCRYHGMHLASINSQEENDKLEKHIRDFGLGHEHFWTSGTDQGEEGTFFWMANGRPVTFENWNTGEPNNFRYENGEEEHCLELWNRDGKGLKWNDSPCSFETYFVCEIQ